MVFLIAVIKLSNAEIATAKCTKANGGVTFSKINGGQELEFHDIPTSADDSAAWYCDVIADLSFTQVVAAYTLVQLDPRTGAVQDPDDSVAMVRWGADASGWV
jgi:hypothetical protein